MTGLKFLAFILSLWAIHELILGLMAWKRRRKMEHILRIERIQARFAMARNQLVDLFLSKQVDPNSLTFRLLYYFNTALMRRPDEYPKISAELRRLLISNGSSPSSKRLHLESETWTPEIKKVVMLTADAMGYLIVECFLPFRIISRLASLLYRLEKMFAWLRHKDHSMGNKSNIVRFPEKPYFKWVSRKHPVVSEIRETQEEMYKLAAA